ncbi:MAG TPA: ribose 5-phosphate isomerase A, partial [Burkholderiaceae bacterium]|nr:ribose 5-phosphate isomerase A [Burkholderiaceae bacterium]
MNQDELKIRVGRAALDYVVPGQVLGVGTGSTVNRFIEALADRAGDIPGAVSSSEASTARLRAIGLRVFDATEVDACVPGCGCAHCVGGGADVAGVRTQVVHARLHRDGR